MHNSIVIVGGRCEKYEPLAHALMPEGKCPPALSAVARGFCVSGFHAGCDERISRACMGHRKKHLQHRCLTGVTRSTERYIRPPSNGDIQPASQEVWLSGSDSKAMQ